MAQQTLRVVSSMASVGTRKREVLGAKEIRALKFLRSRILQLPTKVMSTSLQTWYVFTFFVFFLWYGRSRSKARSLHEKKLLVRKLLHGHMDAGGHMQLGKSNKPKHNPQTQGKTQIPQPDLRLTIRKTAKQTANGARAQQEKPQKICQGHGGNNPLCRNKLKNMQQTN